MGRYSEGVTERIIPEARGGLWNDMTDRDIYNLYVYVHIYSYTYVCLCLVYTDIMGLSISLSTRIPISYMDQELLVES